MNDVVPVRRGPEVVLSACGFSARGEEDDDEAVGEMFSQLSRVCKAVGFFSSGHSGSPGSGSALALQSATTATTCSYGGGGGEAGRLFFLNKRTPGEANCLSRESKVGDRDDTLPSRDPLRDSIGNFMLKHRWVPFNLDLEVVIHPVLN